MKPGSLVTIANIASPNFIHFVFESGTYCTTGGRPIPNAGKLRFAGFARAAGYTNVHEFEKLFGLERAMETY